MTYGPCGGVRGDGSCELGTQPCPFVGRSAAVAWAGPPVRRDPSSLSPLLVGRGSDPLVVTDLTVRPFDRSSIEEVVGVLRGSCDAVLVGEHQSRPDFPPPVVLGLVRAAGAEPIVTLTCRDRNRVVLEQELHGLAAMGAPGVLCVTGDIRAPGTRRDVTQVFDLDGPQLAHLAATTGVAPFVPESPAAPPTELRPRRLAEKQAAGAQACVLNHTGTIESVRRFVGAARAAGATLPIVAAVPVFTDERSAAVLSAFPGIVLTPSHTHGVLGAEDPVAAGIDHAVEEALRLLEIDGVVGVNLSGLANATSHRVGAEIKATIGARIKEGR